MPLPPEQLKGRRVLDFDVLTAMSDRCAIVAVEAYASGSDLRARRNRITDRAAADRARHYRVIYRIRTLVGAGRYTDETHIHIDTEVSNFPYQEPASWVLTQTPWSPHFKTGAVVCTGDHWKADGHTLLGHLVRHHAKLLNWDEKARGGGYRGWNGAAIDWHRRHYGDKPLAQGLRYPEIPVDIAYGLASGPAEEAGADLFGGGGRNGMVTTVANGAVDDLFQRSGR